MDITSGQIEIFLTLAKNLSFSKTAETLITTQPTVSRNIKILEKELGCQLFDRSKRNVRITQAGLYWMRKFMRITKIIEAGKKETKEREAKDA